LEQQADNPSGTETAEEVEPTLNADEQAEQEEVNDAIEDDAEDEAEPEAEPEADAPAEPEPWVSDVQRGDRLDENGPNDRTEHFYQRENAAEAEPESSES
jgi:hypothetical protein